MIQIPIRQLLVIQIVQKYKKISNLQQNLLRNLFVNYLGDLYSNDSTSIDSSNVNEFEAEIKSKDSTEKIPKGKNIDRYNY